MGISPPKSKKRFTTKDKGDAFEFINREYTKGKKVKLKIGDEVIIHPVSCRPNDTFRTTGFISQATKPYPAKIVVHEIPWVHGSYPYHKIEPKLELCLTGIRENKKWHGAVLNEYGFNRLEFVQRNLAKTFLETMGIK